ncbi:MAG: lipooligosaccharide transport system permease protein [Acidimicrobiales bacterium]|jgi:lipooligosaccharide transport system permease protein
MIRWAGLSAFLTHQALRSRSTWRTTIISGVVTPVFFLLALGVGLGSMVTDRSGLGTTDYLSFVGPGLLATAAMQQGGQQSLWPTLGALKWEGNYQAALLTPLTSAELATGHILWIGARLLVSSVLFTLVLFGFGIVASPLGLLAPLVATLTGLSFAAPLSAFCATRDSDMSFSLIVRGLLFVFLFSGAFFPIDQLPAALQWAARVMPVWHGVELCRSLLAGSMQASDLLRLGYLILVSIVGWRMALRTFGQRLAP